jgi:KDO2-lipid IV(A) lauroyltransferase
MSTTTELNPTLSSSQQLRRDAGEFWLRKFFWLCEHTPRVVQLARPIMCRLAFAYSPSIRRGTRANASRILGPSSSRQAIDRLARQMLNSFFLFCCDVARSKSASREDLLARVEQVDGREAFQKARALRRGLIVFTAHMGSFEVAMAALTDMEKHVHVLFRRDGDDLFERQRADLRRRLGVHEAVVDDGWTVWMKLRQALLDDQVVVIQGDRVLPGQKGQRVPFLGSEMELPLGPIKLAAASGAPIVPVFSIRMPDGKIRLVIEPAIEVAPDESPDRDSIHPAMKTLAAVLEKHISAHPDQWLMLQPA